MAKPDDDRSTYWYYRVGGREEGPVLTNRLRQLARKGELAAEDFVRRGKMGDWVEAGSIEEIDAKPRARAPAGASPRQAPNSATDEDDEPGVMAGLGASFWTSLKYSCYDALAGVTERSWLLRRIGLAALLIAAIAALVKVGLNADLSEWAVPADPFVTYNALWSELKQKRAAHANDDEWNALAERGKREVAPIVARLEKLASARNRSAQLLLWADRDCLPQMLADARTEPSASERRFEEYLTSADRLRQGQPIKGYNPAQEEGLARSAWRWIAVDPLGAAVWAVMVPLDVAIVAWLFSVWRKRGIGG